MRRPYLLILALGVLVTAHPLAGCFHTPEYFDFGSPDDPCIAAGGTCESTPCESDSHPVEASCDGLAFIGSSNVCCAPGAPRGASVAPPPKGSNTCNEDACREGCTCTSVAAANGGCEAYCNCSPGAGTPADAGDVEAPDATAPAPAGSCGTITCAPGCGCANRNLSKCTCAPDACLR